MREGRKKSLEMCKIELGTTLVNWGEWDVEYTIKIPFEGPDMGIYLSAQSSVG